MGSYNSEYQEYYDSMLKRRNKGFSFGGNSLRGKVFSKKVIIRRVIQELIGGVLLFLSVVFFKTNALPQNKVIYSNSKKIMHQNYDYRKINSEIKSIHITEFSNNEEVVSDWLENLKVKYFGGVTIKTRIKESYMMPLKGKVITRFLDKDASGGIDIQANENSEIKSAYAGKVKSIGEDSKLGKYIEIDHGEGIVTKYSNLNNQLVKKDHKVKKGQVIATSVKASSSKGEYLHFEILYMGKKLNPEEYMTFVN